MAVRLGFVASSTQPGQNRFPKCPITSRALYARSSLGRTIEERPRAIFQPLATLQEK